MKRGCIVLLFFFLVALPVRAQTTNQLYMTGTGSGNTPVIYTSGVDTNINMAFMPKGTGNVGIGTASPASKLHVYSTTLYDGIAIDGTDAVGIIFDLGGASKGTLGVAASSAEWENLAASGDLILKSDSENLRLGDTVNQAITFDVGPNNGAMKEAMRITSTGYVGIGTTSPGNALDIEGTGTAFQQYGQTIGVTAQSAYASTQYNAYGSTLWIAAQGMNGLGAGGAGVIDVVTVGNPLLFEMVHSEVMRVTSTGSVGIGTTSPGAKFDLGSTSTGAAYALRSTISGAANTGYAGYFSNTATGAVNYGIYATTASTTGWAGYFGNNIYVNGTVTMSSDRRLKKHIQTLDPAWHRQLELRGTLPLKFLVVRSRRVSLICRSYRLLRRIISKIRFGFC